MPIKGISDKRRLPRLGKIHLGIRATSTKGTQYPKAVDYFVVPDEVKALYGEQPKSLDIMFPVPDRDLIFPQWLKAYGKTGLLCKGDGETAFRVDPKSGEIEEIECAYEECDTYKNGQCRKVGHLQFLLPLVPGLGVYQIDTSSYHSILNLNSCLDMIQGAIGRVHMIPLVLSLKEQQVQPDGVKKTVYVMHLTAKVSLWQLLKAKQSMDSMFLLAPPSDEEVPEDLFLISTDGAPEASQEAPAAPETPASEEPEPEQHLDPAQPQKQEPQKAPEPEKPKQNTSKVHQAKGAEQIEGGFWTNFWGLVRGIGLTPEQVHELAGTDSLKGLPVEWLQGFKAIFASMKELGLGLDDVKAVLGARQVPSTWKSQQFQAVLQNLREYAEARKVAEQAAK